MAKYLSLPNGSSLKVPDDMGYDEAMALAKQQFPETFGTEKPAPKTGILADIAGSASNLLNIGRTGIAALTGDANAAAVEGLKREQATQEKYQSGFDPEKITQPWEKGQYLTSAGEAIKQIPSAMASLVPSIGQEMGLAAAGRLGGGALGALAGPGGSAVGATVGQYAVPLIVNAIQALGGQAQEKAQMQQKAGEKVDVDTLELAPYAAANAALNLLGTRIAMPSIFKKAIGQQVAAEADDVARAALLAEARKVAGRGTLETIGRGVGGFAIGELPTEILQDVVDRAAVGKSLTDDDAITGYRNTALTMVLASPLGGGFGLHERSGSRAEVGKADLAEKRTSDAAAAQQAAYQAAIAAQKEEERLQSPEHAVQLGRQYDDLFEQFKTQKAALVTPGKDASPVEKAEYKEAQAAVTALNNQLKELVPEYRRTKTIREQELEKQRVSGMSPEEYALEQTQAVSTTQVKPKAPDLGGYYEQQIAVPGEQAKKEAADYAKQQLLLANDHFSGAPSADNTVEYLAHNPRLAQYLVDNNIQLPVWTAPKDVRGQGTWGLMSKRDTKDVLNDLKQLLDERQTQATAQGQAGTKLNQERLGTVEQEEAAGLEDQRQMRAAYEMQQEGRNATDIENIKPQSTTTAQGELFGGEQQRVNMPVAGTRADIDTQITELQKKLDVARSYGAPTAVDRRSNREQVSSLLEQINDLKDRQSKMGADATAFGNESAAALQAYIAAGTPPIKEGQTVVDWYDSLPEKPSSAVSSLPAQERAQREAASARDAAYEALMSGNADARQDVIDNLVKEIAVVRGNLKPETITQIENQANGLLDSSLRYKHDATPALDALSTRWRAGTRAGVYGAAQAIPTTTTPDMLLKQMDQAFGQRDNYDPQTLSVLDKVAENYGAVTANEDRRNLVGEWLNRTTTGNVSPEMTREVQDALATLERGKISETETPTRKTAFGTATKPTQTAIQEELPAEMMPEQVAPQATTRIVNGKVQYVAPEDRGPIQGSAAERYAPQQTGTVFGSFAELNKYLASDYLKAARQEMGLAHQTVARMGLKVKEHEAKIANITKQIEALQERKAKLAEVETSETKAAKNIVADAEIRLEAVLNRLSDEMEPLRIAYMQARSQVEYAAQQSEETSRLVANNIANFKEMDDRAVAAAEKTAQAKAGLLAAYNKLGNWQEKEPGITAARAAVIEALKAQRNPLYTESAEKLQKLQKQLSKAKVSQPRTVAQLQKEIAELQDLMDTQRVNPYVPSSAFITFLNNDLRLQLDAQEEERKLDSAARSMLNTKLALEMAATDLDVNISQNPEILALKKEIGTAKDLQTDALIGVRGELAALDNELAQVENTRTLEAGRVKDVEDKIRAVSESRGFAAQMANVTIQPLSATERDAVIARDKARIDEFQAHTAAWEALPGQRIDFTKRREMLDLIKTATEDFAKLDASIAEMETGVTEMQVRVELTQIKLDALEDKAKSYRGPRKNLKEAKPVFAEIAQLKTQIDAGNERVDALRASIAQYEKTRTTKEVALAKAERATSSDSEVYAEVTKTINDRNDKLEKTISKKRELTEQKQDDIAKLSKDIKEKRTAGKTSPETLKTLRARLDKLKSSQKERRKQLAEFVKERTVLQAIRSNRLGITRTDVLTKQNVSTLVRKKDENGKYQLVPREKKTPQAIQAEFDTELERQQIFAVRSNRLEELQKSMAVLQKAKEPKTETKKTERAEKISALQGLINEQIKLVDEVRPAQASEVSQATRIQSAAPGKMRAGTAESKANAGITKQPIVESRTPAQITSEKAVADANAFVARLDAAKNKKQLDSEFAAKEVGTQNQIIEAVEDNVKRLDSFISKNSKELAELAQNPSGNPKFADRRDKLRDDIRDAQFMLNRSIDDRDRLYELQIVSDTTAGEDVGMPSGFKDFTGQDVIGNEDIDTTYDPRYEFSRGTPVQGLTTTELRSELRKAVGDEDTYANKVAVYKSVGEFLQTKPKYKGQIPFDAKAFVDPDTERAYMFADNIAKNEGLAILLHEVGVHIGFRNFFNAGQYKALANAVRSWSKAPANTLEGKIGRAAEKRVREAGTSAAQMDDELIAYAVEEAVKAGVEPAGVKGGSAVANWLRMLVKAFTKALEKFGLAPESIKVGDLVNMAYGAAQLELKGTWHGTARAFKEFDHAYMGMGEGQQAFGWGTYRAQAKRVAESYAATAVDAATQRAYDDPAFVKWLDESVPTIDGKSLKDLESKGHRLYFGNTNPNLVPAAPNAQGKVLAKPIKWPKFISPVFKNKVLAPKPLPLTYKMELVDFPDSVRATVLNALREVSDTKLYNGVAFDVVDAVKDVLKSSTSKENKAALTWVENNADRIGGGAQKKAPLVLPPEEGAMLRTLHEQHEDAFFNLDNQIPEQSDQVQTALEKVFYSLTDQQKAKFNRHLAGEENPSGKDVYDAFKLAIGNQRTVSERMASFGIAGNKFLDRYSRGKPVTEDSRYNYVDFLDKDEGAAIIASDINPIGPASGLLFSRKTDYGQDNALTDFAKSVVATPKTLKEKVGNHAALEAEMWGVDMRAGLREALKAGAKEMGNDKLFTQAMYNVLKADQRMSQVNTALTNGWQTSYTDEKGLHGFRSANAHNATEIFQAVADVPYGNAEGKAAIATAYLIAQRTANKNLAKLDLGALGITQAQLDAALAAANADPKLKTALENVRRVYNAFNEDGINFLASTGAITKALAKELLKDGDYVPFYRVNANGMAELVFNNEVTITIGDVRRQPYLNELKGGETKILSITESIPRNTMLLMDKALTNLAAKNIAYTFQTFGEGKGPISEKTGLRTSAMPIHTGQAPAGNNIIKFNQEPDSNKPDDDGQRWQRVVTDDTIMGGIPAELIVKSLEGAHLTLPAFLKIGGYAGDILRAGVTRMPIYIGRQLVRDPMAASFTGGLNYGPLTAVAKAGREFVRMMRGTSTGGDELIRKGLIQSGIFTGDPDDLKKIALQLASGKDQGVLDKIFAATDRAAMRADAATRVLVYDNAIKNGLSEVEAEIATMESMNFYKRGLSPTVQYASRLIPFFNAQIQGLNVLYKAARGQMPFEEQQRIQQKFFNNAMMLVGTGILYAMAMEDDEYFKNAKPKDKYSNFFLHLPGVAEPLKIPIPYEAGWFFSLAVAASDAMKAEVDGKQQLQGLRDMFLQSIPGYTSMLGPVPIPQLFKPLAEVAANKSFFTGNAIESARMERMTPEQRFGASTTEAAKAFSKALPLLSPVQIEHLSNGYFGQLPLIVMAAANGLFKSETRGEAPTARLTDMPFIGSSFQRQYGGADADVMFRMASDAMKAKATFDDIRKKGQGQEAKDYLENHRAEIASAGPARQYQAQMGRLRLDEDRITNMEKMTADEKRVRIDRIDAARQDVANRYEAALKRLSENVDKTKPQ